MYCPLVPTHTKHYPPPHTQTTNAIIEFSYITTSLIGNEVPDMSDLLLVIADDNGRDVDVDPSNNARTVTFEPTARANLAVNMYEL